MQNSILSKVKRVLTRREIVLIIAMIVASIIIALIEPVFLKRANILSILMSITVDGLIAIGMVLVLACGELDLSVGMTMAFTGVAVGLLMLAGVPIGIAIVLALVLSMLIGLINGFLTAVVGLNSFITTLGMSCALEGLMLVLSNGHSVTGLPDGFKHLGQGTFLGVQYPIYILLVIVIIMDVLFRNARSMRQIYYVGSNQKAAKLSGINVKKVKISSFMACALFSGMAGIIITARFGSSSVTIGGDTAMDAITACIIGGASLSGGKGSVWGSVLGALFLAMLSTALNLLSVNIYWQNFVTGVILIGAILFDALSEKKKALGKVTM